MTFVETISEEQATGEAAELLKGDRELRGYAPNYSSVLAHRPEIYAAWQALNAAIRASMDLRRNELATLAAARRLRSSYCMLAHGAVLEQRFLGADGLRSVATDHHAAGLEPVEVAIMDLAEKIVDDATSVTREDIDGLRDHGLSDVEIVSVVAAVTARCFFSKTLDALGAEPDSAYEAVDPALKEVLVVGRPIERG
jgi:uncharacterized peroxidase-related enzyme